MTMRRANVNRPNHPHLKSINQPKGDYDPENVADKPPQSAPPSKVLINRKVIMTPPQKLLLPKIKFLKSINQPKGDYDLAAILAYVLNCAFPQKY